jgi:hypothetical protein
LNHDVREELLFTAGRVLLNTLNGLRDMNKIEALVFQTGVASLITLSFIYQWGLVEYLSDLLLYTKACKDLSAKDYKLPEYWVELWCEQLPYCSCSKGASVPGSLSFWGDLTGEDTVSASLEWVQTTLLARTHQLSPYVHRLCIEFQAAPYYSC